MEKIKDAGRKGRVSLSKSEKISKQRAEEDGKDDKEGKKTVKFGDSPNQPLSDYDPLEVIPEEYRKHGVDTEPMLHYIRERSEDEDLERLLEAAQRDVRLHQARIKAAAANDTSLLGEYDFSKDTQFIARQERRRIRMEDVKSLTSEANKIICELDEDKKNLTHTERTQVKLARWQRALELYVYCPSSLSMDLLGLLEKLLDGTSEEEELSEVLSQAYHMCSALVDSTQQAVRDATDDAAMAEDAYMIRLEAHRMFANNALRRSDEIQSQFRTNGRAALQIGHQLEFAELKRAQCESAAILIRHWWTMEQLAESEDISGEELKVNEEVRGIIPPQSCRMDPLFTVPERSLEASKALKQLRAVVKSRGNAATAAAAASGGWSDPNSGRRFDLTAKLIRRTSKALEQRLLNRFAQVYSAGGSYDFSEKPRSGSINWVHLRELAQALMMFDSGRNLHQTYVDMVITSRFPELFSVKKKEKVRSTSNNPSAGGGEDSDEEMDFDMDATRSELSSLFHRVSDVCTAEFELIAHVFGRTGGNEEMTLTVARALLQRVISDQNNGLQSRISDLLQSIDRRGDFDAGAKKLDTFVVIHEKAAGLFHLLRDAAEKMIIHSHTVNSKDAISDYESTLKSVTALKQFLTSQEIALSSGHRKGYLNLELRLLHHNCCATLQDIGCVLDRPKARSQDLSLADKGILEEYRAPILPINSRYLMTCDILLGPLKSSVLRQPLIFATDSLARARLMFGDGKKGGDATARVITSIFNQMCNFYGPAYLYPIVQALGEKLNIAAPHNPPQLPFDEIDAAPELGVPAHFWVALEYIHTNAKSFDRELWAENRPGSGRVWEILHTTGGHSCMAQARKYRIQFFAELESRGEAAIHRALQTLSEHIRWILVSGGESMFATGGNRFFSGATNGPYAIPTGSSLETPNSPAVKSLTFCLRSQFVNIQAALTPTSLSAFWSALSMRLYDIFVPRLIQHYTITQVGAVILSRDVEALRSVSMLAGTNHAHWDNLREAVTLYMTPPGALKSMLVGPEGDVNSGKGLFKRVGRYQSLVFMSRRSDFRAKTNQGPRKATWVVELLDQLGVPDPTDTQINMGMFAAERKN
mmetsp:Transcript_7021/g.10243  ORF Transcript_7021/g.10243 Transcript_7021/m.10243 type:complete len:1101 (+) Transcript_7021:164-3466(+)